MDQAREAFLWIVDIFRKQQIPFQITGGMAAKIYGSPRKLNDIDIDIPEEKFSEIVNVVKKYITYGPKRYRDEKWDVYLMTLNYQGQEIDISGAESVRINTKNNSGWLDFPTDFSQAEMINLWGISVPVISRKELIKYKSELNGDHQQVDIAAISKSIL